MKVRISGNSIRFRLKEPEVIHFSNTGKISEQIQFGPDEIDCIHFILEKSSADILNTSFEKNQVTIRIPFAVADEWTETSQVGIKETVKNGNNLLSVLIEKDFACLDRSVGDNEGTYPNPLSKKLIDNVDR